LSVKISSPFGPTTSAGWHPFTTGGVARRAGRNVVFKGMHLNRFRYTGCPFPPRPPPLTKSIPSWLRCSIDVSTQLSQILHQVVGEGIVIVEDEDHT
jgi:hypothetical protein